MSPGLTVVREASIWYRIRARGGDTSLQTVLRSVELKPDEDVMLNDLLRSGAQQVQVEHRREAIVRRLVDARRRLLPSPIPESDGVASAGRLLAFELEASFFDGVVFAETGGFFDESDLPPWDLWVAYASARDGRLRLVSWIPEEFLDLAEAAVRVHNFEAFRWLEPAEFDAMMRTVERDGP